MSTAVSTVFIDSVFSSTTPAEFRFQEPEPIVMDKTVKLLEAEETQSYIARIALADTRQAEAWLQIFRRELFALRRLKDGWDSYDAPPPQSISIAAANDFLNRVSQHSAQLRPTRIAPSAEGGIVISFLTDDDRANIEFFDTGEVCAAIDREGCDLEVWEIEPESDGLENALLSL